MQFNPFSSFRKYQKFWMATILLLCMVTFVLCTGMQGGDLMDLILKNTGRRSGDAVITVNGVSYDYDAVERLKAQRNIADSFMRHSCQLAVEVLDEMYKREAKKEPKKGDQTAARQHQFYLLTVGGVKEALKERMMRKRYFSGGVKLEELADFLMWKAEADRLGVQLVKDSVMEIYDAELLNEFMKDRFGFRYFSPDHSRRAYYETRGDFRHASDDMLINALRDEFRVRIAQLALEKAQITSYEQRDQKEARNLRLEYPISTRAPLTPEQLWESYREERSEFDVRLLPVAVEDFAAKVKAPTPEQLAKLFKDYQDKKYDPTSPTPGFEIPYRVKIGWVMGDPQSKRYQHAARTALLLETIPPVWNPAGSPLQTLVGYLAGPAALDASLERDYENYRKREAHLFQSTPIGEGDMHALLLARQGLKSPQATAAFVAASAVNPALALTSFYAVSTKENPAVESLARAEQARRDKVFEEYSKLAVELAASGLTGPFVPRDPFVAATVAPKLAKLFEQEQHLPLPLVRDEIAKRRHTLQATEWAQNNMLAVRDVLDKVEGKKEPFELQLEKLVAKHHLEHGETKDFYHRFNIEKAAELKPLEEAFKNEQMLDQINIIEGRARNTDQAIATEDYADLFFDIGMPFSVASERYKPRPWPPIVEAKADVRAQQDPDAKPKPVDLFASADKPVLFWKTDDRSAEAPKSQDAIAKQVEEAYRQLKARDEIVIPRAQDIAETLQKSGGEYLTILEKESDKLGRDMIELRNVAPLAKIVQRAGLFEYTRYQLPKEDFVYPTDDMTENLLKLPELKEPIKTGNKAVDEINKNLFRMAKSTEGKVPFGIGKYVQIFANKPQTMFYVAAVTRAPTPLLTEFRRAYQFGIGMPDPNNFERWGDTFINRAQEEFAEKYRDGIRKALGARFEVSVNEERKKDFDQ